MSQRNILATHNLLAVSADVYESAINTPGTCNVAMMVKKDDIIQVDRRRQTNADEAIGKEEPDLIYDLGGISQATLNFDKAQPQHFAFLLAYALGECSVAAAGATGYKHTIVPIEFDLDSARSCPSFTAVQRLGNQVLKERFSSMFVDGFNASFPKDDWCKISGTIKGTGKRDDNVYEETIVAKDDATSLTLAANGVQGADAATRLANVQRIIAEYPSSGIWADVTYTAVSAATPAVITIASLGGASADINYKVLYIPTEAAWGTIPAEVTETALRTVQLAVNIGGKWDGSAIAGGHSLGAELKNLDWKYNNNGNPEFTPGSGVLDYATRYLRGGRTQNINLGREFQDYVYQQHIDDNDTFVVYMKAEGAEYVAGHKYTVEVVFPKVAVMKATKGVDNNRLSESLELQVLEDDTYGSVVAYVKNMQAKYAQAA